MLKETWPAYLQIDSDYWFRTDPKVSTTDLWGEHII